MDHPPEAKKDCPVKGRVALRAVLHKSGNVAEVEIIKRPGRSYDEAAVEAVRKYKFTPAMKDGRLVSQYDFVEYSYNFF